MKQPAKHLERYDWVDSTDTVRGSGTTRAARKKGLKTRSVHIFLVNEHGELLLAQRSKKKLAYPGLFTSSAGGHVEQGETYLQAAKRELKEELGIRGQLRDAGRFDVFNTFEDTIHHLFILPLKKNAALSPDRYEIERLVWKSLPSVWRDAMNNPERFAPPFFSALEAYAAYAAETVYVFDFDHTSFDWYSAKAALETHLHSVLGISPKHFRSAKDTQETNGLYDIRAHLSELARVSNTPLRTIQSQYKQWSARMASFLYPDAVQMLRALTKRKQHVVLLTYGDPANQQHFIEASGIHKIVEHIYYARTKSEKTAVLKKLMLTPVRIVFVNDDPAETQEVCASIPLLKKVFLVERKDAKFPKIPRSTQYTVVSTLRDVRL